MMRVRVLTAAAAAALFMAAAPLAAQASGTTTTTEQKVHVQLVRYYHADGYIKAIGQVAYRTIYSPNARIRNKWKRATHWLFSVRRDAARKLYALRHPYVARPAAGGVGHWRLWNCIHNGAYPGAPHEGDSSTGTYTGWLQMTNPWEGHSGNWHAMGSGVYAIAEQEYAAHGYSRVWLEGQWPRTSPPCLGYA